jgi:hypothetical protein
LSFHWVLLLLLLGFLFSFSFLPNLIAQVSKRKKKTPKKTPKKHRSKSTTVYYYYYYYYYVKLLHHPFLTCDNPKPFSISTPQVYQLVKTISASLCESIVQSVHFTVRILSNFTKNRCKLHMFNSIQSLSGCLIEKQIQQQACWFYYKLLDSSSM